MPFRDYRVTSPFGFRRDVWSGIGFTFHTGIDLVKSHKANIQAFTEGKVIFAGMGRTGTGLGGFGIVVLLQDKNNRGQLYAHLDSVSVQPGQFVKKGQVIGKQGDTGNVTGSHLHYEVRKKAESQPPYGWTSDRVNNCLDPTKYLQKFSDNKTIMEDIQTGLNRKYDTGLAVDGIAGPLTIKAAIKGYQIELNKQFNANLTVDGIWGQKTKSATVTIASGAKGNITWILQAMLYINGEDPKGLDGIFGDNTNNAVRSFQQKESILVDGKAGKVTWEKLFL
ncbi:peptidoglycan DD-metalloendopeptidase family protein [Oceanobacillus iheyensis]|uniref:Uncharacterized protein n=1 Tax=Oceanobacillus iheyensis (strain DSM 14371 / CIP 107618 / JCM 11309 / KCTC 3954 / HTE831) TaxID=221109 RepID=Q8EQM9_OCEIH|nr:peptidoglycan DD-metalloendopeptidase family protein [Oceanobacillus iheyensis]BAC13621.1 hypothetical protein [Oceanobacillus iheyensis HTE831]